MLNEDKEKQPGNQQRPRELIPSSPYLVRAVHSFSAVVVLRGAICHRRRLSLSLLSSLLPMAIRSSRSLSDDLIVSQLCLRSNGGKRRGLPTSSHTTPQFNLKLFLKRLTLQSSVKRLFPGCDNYLPHGVLLSKTATPLSRPLYFIHLTPQMYVIS